MVASHIANEFKIARVKRADLSVRRVEVFFHFSHALTMRQGEVGSRNRGGVFGHAQYSPAGFDHHRMTEAGRESISVGGGAA